MKGCTLEFGDFLKLLRRNWLFITATTLIGVLLSGAITLSLSPTYTASTRLFVAMQSAGTVSELQQGNTFTEARVQSYVKTVKTPAVLQPVIDSLDLQETPDLLSRKISASSDPNTVLLSISVSDESPIRAAAIASAVANSVIRVVQELERPAQGDISPVRISIVEPATAPVNPSAPNTRLNLMVGLLVGLGFGLLGSFARTALDKKIRRESDVQKIAKDPILGSISFSADAESKPLITQIPSQSPRAESFRQIRTNLQFAGVKQTANTLLVTSSLPGEGKTTTASNIAIAMGQAGQRVVLVDADLRRPMVAEYLGLEGNAGLTTALVGSSEVEDLLQPWGNDNLYVLTSGRIPPNPSELLGSESMDAIINRLSSLFDTVIIDAPPLIPVTDSSILSQKVGGLILVVGTGKLKVQDLEKSMSSLKLVGANVLGLVLNRLPLKGPDAYEYSYYSYESRTPKSKRKEATNSSRRNHSNRLSRRRNDSDVDRLIS